MLPLFSLFIDVDCAYRSKVSRLINMYIVCSSKCTTNGLILMARMALIVYRNIVPVEDLKIKAS